ncbi:DUF4256 family protein [Candidatus Peregrinibacteria bacterium]|jgi:hypothetical protein|nr:DUF4256 family protein [Candidatus Peregrinibacteria bacterium]
MTESLRKHSRHVDGSNLDQSRIRIIDIENLVELHEKRLGLRTNLSIIGALLSREQGEVRNELAQQVLEGVMRKGGINSPEMRTFTGLDIQEAISLIIDRSRERRICSIEDWNEVKQALARSPRVYNAITGMETYGHNPVIYFADLEGFKVGTDLSVKVPKAEQNCAFNAESEARINGVHLLDEGPVNGNATDKAAAMGVSLMTWGEAKKFRHCENHSSRWLHTPKGEVEKLLAYTASMWKHDEGTLSFIDAFLGDDYPHGKGWAGSISVPFIKR